METKYADTIKRAHALLWKWPHYSYKDQDTFEWICQQLEDGKTEEEILELANPYNYLPTEVN